MPRLTEKQIVNILLARYYEALVIISELADECEIISHLNFHEMDHGVCNYIGTHYKDFGVSQFHMAQLKFIEENMPEGQMHWWATPSLIFKSGLRDCRIKLITAIRRRVEILQTANKAMNPTCYVDTKF